MKAFAIFILCALLGGCAIFDFGGKSARSQVLYDESRDQTRVISPDLYLDATGPKGSEMFLLTCYVVFSGKTLARGPSSGAVDIQVASYASSAHGKREARLGFVLDGERFDVPAGRLEQKVSRDRRSRLAAQERTYSVPVQVFSRMATAKKVNGWIDDYEFDLTEYQLGLLAQFATAANVGPQGTGP